MSSLSPIRNFPGDSSSLLTPDEMIIRACCKVLQNPKASAGQAVQAAKMLERALLRKESSDKKEIAAKRKIPEKTVDQEVNDLVKQIEAEGKKP